jgi:hypothetical protein
MKIPRVGGKLFHLNTQTDTPKPIVALRHVGNSPDKRKRILSQNFTNVNYIRKLPNLYKLKVHYRANNCQPLAHILSQMIPIHTLPPTEHHQQSSTEIMLYQVMVGSNLYSVRYQLTHVLSEYDGMRVI